MSPKSYHSLFWSFLKIGGAAFGGGIAALPVFEAELVNHRHWLTPGEVAESYAISQSIPGVIIVNFAVLTGVHLAGKRGALISAVAVVLPSFFIILAFTLLIGGHWENRWIAGAMSGLRPAVIAIVVGAAIRLGRRTLDSLPLLLAALAGAGFMLARWISPIGLILIGAAAGLAFHFLRRKKKESA